MTKFCINQAYIIEIIYNSMLNSEIKYSKDGIRNDG